jgi:hypothetical protein
MICARFSLSWHFENYLGLNFWVALAKPITFIDNRAASASICSVASSWHWTDAT